MSFDGRERHHPEAAESDVLQADRDAESVSESPVVETFSALDEHRSAPDTEAEDTVPAAPSVESVGSPYRPLTPFTDSDADVFFGRTELWRRLQVRAVPGGGVVTVVGPSGAGKTSLLQAGLIPEVRSRGLRRAQTRVPATVVTMTPGVAPAHSLALAFDIDIDAADGEPTRAVAALGRSAVRADDAACLLVIDQAEELFSLCDRPSRTQFLAVLDALAADDRFAVVLALRADFYDRAVDEPLLVGTLDDRAVVVRPMNDVEVSDAVVEPARARGVTVEPGLTDAIVADLATVEAGAPPLVALGMFLDHLWTTRTGPELTLAAYRASDPLATVMSTTAERAWTRLTESDRTTARLVLLAAIRVTDAGDVVPSGATVDDLRGRLAGQHGLDSVIDHLTAADLVRVDDGRLRLTHDSIIAGWPRAAEWVAQRVAGSPTRAAIVADAARWDAGGHPADELYDAARLQSVDRGVEPVDVLGVTADEFLRRSRDRAALRRNRRRVLLAALVLVAVVALVVAVLSVVRGGSAESERDAARLDAAVARIGAVAASDPTASARLALETYRSDPTDPRAESALLATQSMPLSRSITGAAPAAAVATTGSPDSDRVALVGDDGSISLATAGAVTDTIPDATSATTASGVAVSPDGRLLAAAAADGDVRLWRVAPTGAVTALAPVPAAQRTDAAPAVTAVTFAADRPWLAVADSSGAVRVVDITDPARPSTLSTVRGAAGTREIAFAPVATDRASAPALIVGSPDRRVVRWDLTDPTAPSVSGATITLGSAASALAVSADGATVAVADDAGTVVVASLDASGLRPVGQALGRSEQGTSGLATTVGPVPALSFAPSGHRLAVTAADGSTRVWDLTHPDAPRVLTGDLRAANATIGAARFVTADSLVTAGSGSPQQWSLPRGLLDGGFGTVASPACSISREACVTSFVDGPVQVWGAADPTAPVALGAIDAPDHFDGATMSPDGLWMMTVDAGHRAQLWDVADIATPIAAGPPVALGPQAVGTIRFSPSSGLLAMSTGGNTAVEVFDVARAGLTSVARLDLDGQPVSAVAFSGDSREIALGGADGVVRTRIDTAGTSPISGRLQPGSPVTALAYTDGEVVVGDSTGGVTRWQAATGRAVGARTQLGRAAVTSITVVGSTIATASADGSLHRIAGDGSVRSMGTLYGSLAQGQARLTSAPREDVLVTGDGGAEQFWSLRTADVAARVCTATGASGC